MPNPWLSLWLSAANGWAGAMRGLWAAELHRQQSAMINQTVRQTVRFWTRAFAVPAAGRRTKSRR